MKKESIAFGIILILLPLYGCGGGSSIGGNGLEMNIINAPAQAVEAGGSIYLTIELRNSGKSKISGGLMEIGNYDPSLIPNGFGNGKPGSGQTSFDSEINLEGRSRYSTEGGYKTVTAMGTTYDKMKIDTYSADLRITACYGYETNAGGQICINNDPSIPLDREAECTPGTGTVLQDQGAPVVLSELRSYSDPKETSISFTIRKTNDEVTIFSSGKVATCTESINYDELNLIDVLDVTLGSTTLEKCTNLIDGKQLRLSKDGAGTFECRYTNVPADKVQNRAISVKLAYGVKMNKRQPITIVQNLPADQRQDAPTTSSTGKLPNSASCSQPSQCQSGVCIAGRCMPKNQ